MLTFIEIAKGLLMMYFSIMTLAGKTDEEAQAFFDAQYEKFKNNLPVKLPEV